MKQEDTTEYLTAFLVGAAVGIGAALLLAPKPPTRRERIMNEIRPYGKKVSKKAARARKASQDTGEKMLDVSRSVVDDMRDEVASMVADARTEIADAVADQLDAAQKHLKKTAKRVRS